MVRVGRLLVGLAMAAGSTGPVLAQDGQLKADRRQALQLVYDELNRSHERLADIISDCSGGRILVYACSVVQHRPGQPAPCNERLVSCDVVAVFKALDRDLAVLRKELDAK